IDTDEYHIFRNLDGEANKQMLLDFMGSCDLIVGHNYLGYDGPILKNLLGLPLVVSKVLDTLILSKLIDYPRQGHSIEDYGLEFGIEKGKFSDWSKWSQAMEDYCVRDVDICHRIYNKYHRYISDPDHADSIRTEHE